MLNFIMALLIVTTSPSNAGTKCIAKRKGAEVATSTFDSHGKARLRLPTKGTYTVRYGGTNNRIEHNGKDQSADRVNGLNAEDRGYLEWLEMPTEDKIKAIKNGDAVSHWVARIGVV